MGDKSGIEWTDATWNPTLGCTKVSAGCENCYAIKTAARNQHFPTMKETYTGLTVKHNDGSVNWTGKVRQLSERLSIPLHWERPRRIFVDSMSDLFHAEVDEDFIDDVFAVMSLSPRHTFQLLTKRPDNMLSWFMRGPREDLVKEARRPFILEAPKARLDNMEWPGWPLPNVWIGTSTEDQEAADLRIPFLLECPASVRWISAEPLLGPINIARAMTAQFPVGQGRGLKWVVVGGESGGSLDRSLLYPRETIDAGRHVIEWGPDEGKREWVRSLRDQCKSGGVKFLFKQWGGAVHSSGGRELDGRTWDEYPG